MDYKNIVFDTVKTSIKAGQKILEVYDTNFEVEYKKDNSPLTIADKSSHDIIVNELFNYKIPILSEEGKEVPYAVRKDWKYLWVVDPLDGTKEFIKKNGEFTVNIALIYNKKPVMGVIFAPVLNKCYWGCIGFGAFLFDTAASPDCKNIEDLLQYSVSLPKENNKDYFKVVASRSHLNKNTENYIKQLKSKHSNLNLVSIGSSLKICLIAEGVANIYPRFAPTWEWDTAAGHAILNSMGGQIINSDKQNEELLYNKENLINPWFIAKPK